MVSSLCVDAEVVMVPDTVVAVAAPVVELLADSREVEALLTLTVPE
jgi:hypothetical protein